jgi:hypothetical protein
MFRPSRGHLQTDIWNTALYNKRPYEIMLDKTIKETYLIDIVISNCPKICSTITEKLHSVQI